MLLVASSLFASGTLNLRISNETAPPGGWVQLKVTLERPQPIATGSIGLQLDPTVFGPITDAAVFSVNGDAFGTGGINDRSAGFFFGCGVGTVVRTLQPVGTVAANGIGQVRDLPVFVVNVPVLASATPGKTVPITTAVTDYLWTAPDDRMLGHYDVSVTAGSVTVGGRLSVREVMPGGGDVPAGTTIRIVGTGFSPATTVQVEGVAVSPAEFITAQELSVSLEAPAELTGKRFIIRNSDGETKEYFAFLPGSIARTPEPGSQTLLFPVRASSTPLSVYPEGPIQRRTVVFVQNPNLTAVDLKSELLYGEAVFSESTVTLPIGGTARFDYPLNQYKAWARISPSGPIRAIRYTPDPVAHWQLLAVSTPPLIGAIVNTASLMSGAIAPGEILSLWSTAGAPEQVLFDGTPAVVLGSAVNQTHVLAPRSLGGRALTNVQVLVNGAVSTPWGVPVVPTAPGIFSLDRTGVGQAAVLNQENSVNGVVAPARRGSIIQIFGTGEGVEPLPPVQVQIDGMDAPVRFAGNVGVLFQVNAVVPPGASSGVAVPLSVSIGGVACQNGLTVVVQ